MSEKPSIFANPLVYLPAAATYFATFVASATELALARQLRATTCAQGPCWDFLTTAWAIAIVGSLTSLARHGVLFYRWSRGRVEREGVTLPVGFALLMFWLSIVAVGWSTAIAQPDAPVAQTVDFGGGVAVDSVYDRPPVTGMFPWSVSFYNDVMGGHAGGGSDAFVGAARAGMAATVLCTMSFVWSILDLVFTARASYKAHPPVPFDAEVRTGLRDEEKQTAAKE